MTNTQVFNVYKEDGFSQAVFAVCDSKGWSPKNVDLLGRAITVVQNAITSMGEQSFNLRV